MTTSKSANNSAISPSSENAAKVAWQAVREMWPTQNTESEFSLKLRLKLMAQIAEEIGSERFMEAVEKAISVSFGRYAVSPAKIRECAGLRWTPPLSASAQAWALVTRVFIDHCRCDQDGNYRLEEKVVLVDGKAQVTSVPEIPLAVKKAIQCLGGWAALAEAHPEYWGQKANQFKEFFCEDEPSPRVDSKALVK